jgi:cysteine-rich repeat protein
MSCGDSKKQTGEECDDGNFIDGDGCNSSCIAEAGYNCSNFFTCTKACGDGKIF